MFDKSKNLKVGRDINISINNDIEELNKTDFLEKKKESSIILEKENMAKWKKALKYILFSLLFFVFLYFSLPIIFDFLAEKSKNGIFKTLFQSSLPQNVQFVISTSLAIISIYYPIGRLMDDNDTQKKHKEIIKKIDILLKEKEYLKKA